MSHNRDLSAAAAQIGFHSSNIGIGSEAPRYALDVYNSNLLVSGPSAGNIILEDRGVGDSSRPFHVVSSDGGKFVINRSNRNASGTTTSSVNSLTLNSSGNLGLGQQTSPAANIHIGDISSGYELKVTGNAVQFNRSSNSYIDQLHDTGSILFRMTSSNTEAMRITSAGRIGINETSPSHVLDVKSQAAGTYFINGQNHNGNNIFQVYESSDGDGNHGMLYLNNGSGTTLTKISTNGFSYFNGGSVGINIATPDRKLEVVDTNSNGSYPLAVSNFIDSTANKGAAIDFRMTTGGNTRGELGCKWTSNSSSDGTYFYFAPNDGTTGNIERLRISGDGNMGLGVSPSYSGVFGGSQRVLHIGGTTAPGLRIQSSTSNQGDFIIQAGNSGGSTILANLSNNADTLFYTTSGGSTTEKMRIRAGGQITTPEQPAFQAKLSAATGANFSGVLVFNSVRFNIGNNYNSSNGRFTAPVDGRYLFCWYTNVQLPSTTAIYVDWMINGNVQGNRIYTMWTTGWEGIAGSVIFDLNTNDYLQIYAYSSGNYDGGQYGAFSGCLLG